MKNTLLIKNFVIKVTLIFSLFSLSLNSHASIEINHIRDAHVKELLGKRYRRSIASVKMNKSTIEKRIEEVTKIFLPKKHKTFYKEISKTILLESKKYKLDPFFLMAMISNESSFNPSARGTSGEIGLMQILPSTAKWLSKIYNLEYKDKNDLLNPSTNIIIGAAYINRLRTKYGHGQLYLAAYNMGPRNLRRALKKKIRPIDYTMAVMKRYFEIYERI